MEPTRLRGPGAFLACLPSLLGFHPKESVVIVSLRRRGEVGVILRVDRKDCVNPDVAPLLARSVAAHLVQDRAEGAFLVSYTDDDVRLECPAIEGMRSVVAEVVGEVETWAVVKGRYFSPGCVRESCCPIGGRPVPDAKAVPQAAAGLSLPLHGLVRFAPDTRFDVDEAARRRVARAGARWRVRRERDVIAWRTQSFTAWRRALDKAARDLYPTEPEAGKLVEALQDRRIRDAILISLLPSSDEVAPGVLDGSADDEVSHSLRALLSPREGKPPVREIIAPAWDLLGFLTACARMRCRAPSLTLCAILAWWEGDDDASRDLLARAHRAEPGYRLAGLVECTVIAGIGPGWKRAA